MNNRSASQRALSAVLSFAVVFSIFQPFSVFAAPAAPAVTPDVITSLQTIAVPGTSTFVVPVGVTEIRVKTWGAGGAGGNGSTVSGHVLGGGGGGGGGYAEKDILVMPGDSLTAIVGRGGVSSEEGVGRSGALSSFGSSTILVSASGGTAGKRGAEVQAAAPTISLSATPGQINAGQRTTVTWSSTGTDSCTASGILTGAKAASGSEAVTLGASGTATFSCVGLGGTASASVSIIVNNCGPRGGCYTGPDYTVSGASSAGTTVVAVNPLAAAGTVFTGFAGAGLTGMTLESGVAATDVSFNVSNNIDSTDGGMGARGGAGGLRSTTVAGANGVAPAAGGGGSDIALGGNGADGQIMIESIVRGGPVLNGAPAGLIVSGPTAGIINTPYSFTASSTDPEADDVRYGFDWNNDGTIDEYSAFASSTVQVSTSHSWSAAGTYTFSVYAEDVSGNRSAAVSHTIDITNCGPRGGCYPGNVAPSGLVVTGPVTGTVGTSYAFTTAATDPEGDTVRYGFDWNDDGSIDEYTAFDLSAVATSTSHAFAPAGTYTFQVYAEDVNGGRSAAVSHTIVVTSGGGGSGNLAPSGLIVTSPVVGTTSTSYIFTATATDPESNTLRYGFDWNNDGIIDEYTSLVASGVASSTSHSWSAAGTYTFSVYAEDVVGARSAAVTHTIVIGAAIIPGNNAPVISIVTGTTTPFANTAYSYTATATDADSDDIQYGFDWDNNGIIDTVAGESWSPVTLSGVSASQSNSWGVSGPHTFSVFARDVRGATSTPFAYSVNVIGGLTNVGFSISTTTGLFTSEAGATASFDVVLTAAPLANVTLPVTVSDITEGTTTTQSITFTPATWNVYQTVTVTGVDDSIVDGNVSYAAIVGPSISSDVNFNGLAGQNVSVVNYDNDVAPTVSSGGGSGGGGSRNGPCVGFGCSTTTQTVVSSAPAPVIDTVVNFCPASAFIVTYMRKGSQNDVTEVKKLQWFLNTYENANVSINGVFDDATEQAVKNLQAAHSDEILAPWNVTAPTGIVYITTSSYINRFFCNENPLYKAGDLDTTIEITPSQNPPVDNSADFNGAIGIATTSASSTNPSIFNNLAGVFGAFSGNVMDFLKTIPWYPIVITLLVIMGLGFIGRGIYLKDSNSAEANMSFIKGTTSLAAGTVLNVLNIVSFMKDSPWFTKATDLGMNWLLGLSLMNLLAIFLVCVAFLVDAHVSLSKRPR
ncbi:MAG: peptidoglycan-binding protein [Candidatus Paceibacterota bacterium]|jgi:hypothetical protein